MNTSLLPEIQIDRTEGESLQSIRGLVESFLLPNADGIVHLGSRKKVQGFELAMGGFFVAENLKPFITTPDSPLTQLINLIRTDTARFPEYGMDHINTDLLENVMQGSEPVATFDPPATRLFGRFWARTDDGIEIVASSSRSTRLDHFQTMIKRGNEIYNQWVVASSYAWHQADFPSHVVELASAKEVNQDIVYMQLGIEVANVASRKGYYPYGAVLVEEDGRIIVARNNTGEPSDTKNHAESLAINKANLLKDATLYATKEPCGACATAIVEGPTGIGRVVYSLKEPDLIWQGSYLLDRGGRNGDSHRVKLEQLAETVPTALAGLDNEKWQSEFSDTIDLNR